MLLSNISTYFPALHHSNSHKLVFAGSCSGYSVYSTTQIGTMASNISLIYIKNTINAEIN